MDLKRFWGITCYFNPVGYRRKLPNYRLFRQRLTIPLLTIEFSPTGTFELSAGDADILVQVRDGDVMWQKERLLNLGATRLPLECDHVAWLDCDIIFERSDWAPAAIEELKRSSLCQLFRTIHQLRPGTAPEAIGPGASYVSHESAGSAAASGLTIPVARSTTQAPNPYRRGHAWCARRDLIARHGLYDCNILGGGDNMILFAVTGQAEEFLARGNISAAHAGHYRDWLLRFRGDAKGIGCIEGDLYHLWHGDLEKRRYFVRGEILSSAGYDPATDIVLSPDGCWRWNSLKVNMHRRVREYFEEREEDGTVC
jgi:hypothetical protein